MLNPHGIIHLRSPTTVETRDGSVDNITKVAVWDWSEKLLDDERLIKAHTNNNDVYIPASAVDRIEEFDGN